jgi:hypothetical protein
MEVLVKTEARIPPPRRGAATEGTGVVGDAGDAGTAAIGFEGDFFRVILRLVGWLSLRCWAGR